MLNFPQAGFRAVVSWILILSAVWVLFSCKKDDEPVSGIQKDAIVFKWIFSESDAPYRFIEFTGDGSYVIQEKEQAGQEARVSGHRGTGIFSGLNGSGQSVGDLRNLRVSSNLSPVHFGNYRIEDDRIILSGFGLIEEVSFTSDEFSFSFAMESTGEKDWYVVKKATGVVASSARTKMLCRTWQIDQISFDLDMIPDDVAGLYEEVFGENWEEELPKEMTEEAKGSPVLFSQSGTYLVLGVNTETGETEAGLSEWKWEDTSETAIYYSWDNWTDEWESAVVRVEELTDANLVIKENAVRYHMSRKSTL